MSTRDLPVFPLVADPVRPEVPRDTPAALNRGPRLD